MAARLELVVLCAVALLAAVTPTDARRFGGATFLGRGSYSSSGDVSVPASATKAGSSLLSSILEDEKAQIMREADNSRSSRPAHHKSSLSPTRRSPSPTRRSPPPVKRASPSRRSPSAKRSPPPTRGLPSWFGSRNGSFGRSPRSGTRAEAKSENGFARAEAQVRTSGGGRASTKGHASAGVGGSTGSRSYVRHNVYGRG